MLVKLNLIKIRIRNLCSTVTRSIMQFLGAWKPITRKDRFTINETSNRSKKRRKNLDNEAKQKRKE